MARAGISSLVATLGVSSVIFGLLAWYTDGEYPLEHLIHLTSVSPEGRWCGDGYRRGIDGTLRLEYLDAKWASNQEMGARWRRTAQPSDFVSA